MALKVRRVVTGHDENGKAVIEKDEVMDNVIVVPSGNQGALMWVTSETPGPVDIDDPSRQKLGIGPPMGGSAFRILEVAPGKDAFMHRTDTIDYAIVMKGECIMVLDEGEEVHMKEGDVMVQRGTWHGWENRFSEPCQLAFILISALPPAKHLHPSD